MKVTSVLFVLFVFVSCKTNLLYTDHQPICPKNGTCVSQLFNHKNLYLKEDSIGSWYPIIGEGNKAIYKFVFKKNTQKKQADANYTEAIYLEFNPSLNFLKLEDQDLQKSKVFYQRFCYCKGFSGGFPVKMGGLKIKKISKNSFRIQLQFEVEGIPHLLKNIDQTVFVN